MLRAQWASRRRRRAHREHQGTGRWSNPLRQTRAPRADRPRAARRTPRRVRRGRCCPERTEQLICADRELPRIGNAGVAPNGPRNPDFARSATRPAVSGSAPIGCQRHSRSRRRSRSWIRSRTRSTSCSGGIRGCPVSGSASWSRRWGSWAARWSSTTICGRSARCFWSPEPSTAPCIGRGRLSVRSVAHQRAGAGPARSDPTGICRRGRVGVLPRRRRRAGVQPSSAWCV